MTNSANKKTRYNEIVFSEDEIKTIIDMYINDNISTVQIGKIYSCSHKVIGRLLEKHNIPRTGVSRRKYSLNENYFDSIDSQNKAYILGFLYADGCNYPKKCTVSMALQECDKQILEDIRVEIQIEKELEFLDYSNKHDFGYTYKNQWRLLIFSSHMCDSLDRLGMFPAKSLTLEFPNIDKDLYPHFIRGVFDGDGSIHNPKSCRSAKISITSTFSFCYELQKIFDSIGIKSNIREASNHNGVTAVFEIYRKDDVKSFLGYIYRDTNMYLSRKHDRYIEFSKQCAA